MPNERIDIRASAVRRSQIEPTAGGALRIWAPAKINLNLLVGPLGGDGYHPVDSVVARISLYDQIELRPRRDGQIHLTCNGAECGPMDDNLAVKAARLLADRGQVQGVDIALTKHIPVGAGLGGGSSDAAAAMVGLKRLWSLQVSPQELSEMAAQLGSDVPLFLGPPAARMTGRGQIVAGTQVHSFAAVLIVPGFSCNTAKVYREFDRQTQAMGRQLDVELLQSCPSQWRGMLVNQLQAAAERVAPTLADIRVAATERTQLPVCLTGSGSAIFILCDDLREARQVEAGLDEHLRGKCIIVQSNPW